MLTEGAAADRACLLCDCSKPAPGPRAGRRAGATAQSMSGPDLSPEASRDPTPEHSRPSTSPEPSESIYCVIIMYVTVATSPAGACSPLGILRSPWGYFVPLGDTSLQSHCLGLQATLNAPCKALNTQSADPLLAIPLPCPGGPIGGRVPPGIASAIGRSSSVPRSAGGFGDDFGDAPSRSAGACVCHWMRISCLSRWGRVGNHGMGSVRVCYARWFSYTLLLAQIRAQPSVWGGGTPGKLARQSLR